MTNTIGTKIEPFKIGDRSWDVLELFNHIRRLAKVWSWGAHNYRTIKDKALRFNVQGRHFRGYVYICLAGNDTFTLYFTSTQGNIKDIITDVYIDVLIDTIDKKVEYVKEYKDN